MEREIGSEFYTDCTPKKKNGFCDSYDGYYKRYVMSGRTALDLIVSDIIAQRGSFCVYFPSYCCDSMILPFEKNGVSIKYYTVRANERSLCFEYDYDNGCEVVFLLDYFGFQSESTKEIARAEKQNGKTVIFDTTQSLFCGYSDFFGADYAFASYRKWLDIPCASVYKKDNDFLIEPYTKMQESYITLRTNAYKLKARYLSGEQVKKEDFLTMFSQAEDILDEDYALYKADENSVCKICDIDADFIRNKRRENAEYLLSGLKTLGNRSYIRPVFYEIDKGDCPLFVPVLIAPDKRAQLRRHLIDNKIYCPVHWPLTDIHPTKTDECEIYHSELSLVCDQRYDIDDMKRTIELIDMFGG